MGGDEPMVISRLNVEIRGAKQLIVFEVRTPTKDGRDWYCNIREIDGDQVKDRKIGQVTSFLALRLGVKTVESRIARIACQQGDAESVFVEGIAFPDWSGTREIPESLQRRDSK